MVYKKLLIQVIVRVIGIVVLSLFVGWLIWESNYPYFSIFVLILIAFMAIQMIYIVNLTNRQLSHFFLSIRNDDSTLKISETFAGKSYSELRRSLQSVNQIIKDLRFRYQQKEILSNAIIENSAVGILTIDTKGKVIEINRKGRELLGVHHLVNIKALLKTDPNLVLFFENLKYGASRIVEVEVNQQNKHLLVNCSGLTIANENYKLLSFTDIKNQLDAKELESWQSLINVLTHEIMNSVSPLTCLSEKLEKSYKNIEPETVISEKMLLKTQTGLQVIKEQGEGLMHFVEAYRELSRIPKPIFQNVSIRQLFEHLKTLLCLDEDSNINYQFSISDPDLSIFVDEQLIIQVLVNVMKNAQSAILEKGLVKIRCKNDENDFVQISIADNGSGIKNADMPNIFIPFFTTKENGSGIGLSIARSIMRLHNGKIGLESEHGKGTKVFISFLNKLTHDTGS